MNEGEWLRSYAEGLLQAGHLEEAERVYIQLIENYPENDSYLMALAWLYYDSGRLEEAISCFEKLFNKELTRRMFTGFAFDELVRIYKSRGMFSQLLDVCERACEAFPGEYALMGDLAWACHQVGELERAAAIYRQMIEIDPAGIDAYLGLGNTLIALEDYDGAEEAYIQASHIDPEESATFFARLADEYRRSGLLEKAELAIRKSITCNEEDPALFLMLGDILISERRWEEGWAAYEKAASLQADAAGSYYFRLGNTLTVADLPEQAVEAYKKAIEMEANPFYYLHLARLYVAMGKIDLAQDVLEKIKKEN
ncbi:MAG: tetratricopeptide repeat protein [Syntrophales bacterium]|nr:tetratricopeptide repeat protein [Syntrophales bacterium]